MSNGNGVPVMQPPMGDMRPTGGNVSTTGLAPGQAPPAYAPVAPVQAPQGGWVGPQTANPGWLNAPAVAPAAPQKPPLTLRINATDLSALVEGCKYLATNKMPPSEVLRYYPQIDIDDLREIARTNGLEEHITWVEPAPQVQQQAPQVQQPQVQQQEAPAAGKAKKFSQKRDLPQILTALQAGQTPQQIAASLELKPESVVKAIEEHQAQQAKLAQQPQPGQSPPMQQQALPHTEAPTGVPGDLTRPVSVLMHVYALAQQTGLTFAEIETAASLLSCSSS